jgi:uncharacterized protein (TIGR02145 family)
LQSGQNPNQSSNSVANADTKLDMENKKKSFRYIVKGCALLLCVLFFVCPLVKCSQDNSLTASGWEIATGTGSLYDSKKSSSGSPFVFVLIIIPAVLLILALIDKSFVVLRNISIAGLIAEIIFLIAVYTEINSKDYRGAFELTGINWFIVSIYIGLVCFTQYCVNFFNEEIAKKDDSNDSGDNDNNDDSQAPRQWQEGYFTDPRDSRKYRTVVIGNQTWLAENLNYEAEGGKYYNNDTANGQKYGRLYNWEAAKKACPPGWHLPSDAEWQTLVDFAGKIAAKNLKARNSWVNNGNGKDIYGFSALPSGYANSDGNFYNVGNRGYWWSSTDDNTVNACYRNMNEHSNSVNRYSDVKTNLFSVRCVKD